MKTEITLGALTLIVCGAFLAGCQYGYHRTSEKFFSGAAKALAEKNVEMTTARETTES